MSNEDLLREGECPSPYCIEPAGHGGPHSGERRDAMGEMTRAGALAQLEALANYLNSQGIASKDALRQVIVALSSCACKGREGIVRVKADLTTNNRDDSAYLEATLHREEVGLERGQRVECDILILLGETEVRGSEA